MQRPPRGDRVLVVGWGFIGSAVGLRLRASGSAVVTLTRSEGERTARARDLGVEVVIGDAGDERLLDAVVPGVTHVVYAGGGLLPPAAALSPVEDATATLVPLLALLQALARHRTRTLTYISSGGTVYGNPVRNPVAETDPTRPISPYGASRLAAEVYTQMYSRYAGLRLQTLRCANVYGPGQRGDRGQGAVAVFVSRLTAGLPVQVVGDGHAVRDYVYIDDVADAVTHLVMGDGDAGIVNVGSGTGYSVAAVLEAVSAVSGRDAVVERLPSRAEDVDTIVLDITKLRSLVPYQPLELAEGIRRTMAAWGIADLTEARSAQSGQ